MKSIIALSLLLLSSKVFAYPDCPETGNWIKDGFCQVTGGILVKEKYEKPLAGDIFNNPFQSCKEPWPADWCKKKDNGRYK